MHPRSHEHPRMRLRLVNSRKYTRPQLLVCGRDSAKKTSERDRLEKYKPPKNLVLKVREVLIFKVVVLPITFGGSVRERRLHL